MTKPRKKKQKNKNDNQGSPLIASVSSNRYDNGQGPGQAPKDSEQEPKRAPDRDGDLSPMGIVSFCPNGHRTKLKDHYAGKRVYCPQCGTKFRVNTAGTPSPAAAREMMPEFESPFAATAVSVAVAAAEAPTALVEHKPPASGPTPVTAEPAAPTTEPADSQLPAAIATATDALWCIAVPGGEPSPPMTGTAMVAWLTAARGTGKEVVWRTGWADWQPITSTFPEFFGHST